MPGRLGVVVRGLARREHPGDLHGGAADRGPQDRLPQVDVRVGGVGRRVLAGRLLPGRGQALACNGRARAARRPARRSTRSSSCPCCCCPTCLCPWPCLPLDGACAASWSVPGWASPWTRTRSTLVRTAAVRRTGRGEDGGQLVGMARGDQPVRRRVGRVPHRDPDRALEVGPGEQERARVRVDPVDPTRLLGVQRLGRADQVDGDVRPVRRTAPGRAPPPGRCRTTRRARP